MVVQFLVELVSTANIWHHSEHLAPGDRWALPALTVQLLFRLSPAENIWATGAGKTSELCTEKLIPENTPREWVTHGLSLVLETF